MCCDRDAVESRRAAAQTSHEFFDNRKLHDSAVYSLGVSS